jgi:hypothetical protein
MGRRRVRLRRVGLASPATARRRRATPTEAFSTAAARSRGWSPQHASGRGPDRRCPSWNQARCSDPSERLSKLQ